MTCLTGNSRSGHRLAQETWSGIGAWLIRNWRAGDQRASQVRFDVGTQGLLAPTICTGLSVCLRERGRMNVRSGDD